MHDKRQVCFGNIQIETPSICSKNGQESHLQPGTPLYIKEHPNTSCYCAETTFSDSLPYKARIVRHSAQLAIGFKTRPTNYPPPGHRLSAVEPQHLGLV